MRLRRLFPDLEEPAASVEVSSLAYDNRAVTPGTLFFCVPGFSRDGHDFALDAVRRGAAALVVERPLDGIDVPQVVVEDVRIAMAPAAAAFHEHPTERLQVVGVTGTNGKTTTAYLVRAILEADGRRTGLLGTVTSIVGGRERPVKRTTPEAIDLQRTFAEMLAGGDVACVMEVSSHALALHRADAIGFDAGIFTNLTQDHLDFHPTMEAYFAAKRRLFEEGRSRTAVVNLDDGYGRRLAAELPEALTFSLDRARSGASYVAVDIATDLRGSTFEIVDVRGGERHRVRSPLRGSFNVQNVLGAFAAARALGVPAAVALRAIAAAGQVPGRFETIDEGQPFAVVVDYAHTPDSLENVLRTARPLARGRLHVVFGCGGDRDRGKRPQMGEIAARLADLVIVTSDNPRSEDPESIIEQILAGIDRPVEHDPDRRSAIERAILRAEPGDVVVIAGKGHERGQEFADGWTVEFDDAAVAREALASRAQRRADRHQD